MTTLKELEALRAAAEFSTDAALQYEDGLHDTFPALLSSWRAMREVLGQIEHVMFDAFVEDSYCPSCRASRKTEHLPDCPLAAALAQARELEG